MSAGAVWTLLGIYPLAGTEYYVLGSPSFANVTVRGGGLTVLATNSSGGDNVYVAQVKLNGVPLSAPFVRHADLLRPPAILEFTMTDTPVPWMYVPPL